MKKTREGLKILGKRARGNPLLRGMVGEERVNLRAEVLIRRAREEAGLTQAELARRIGTTQSAIARLEDADYTGHTLKLVQRILLETGYNLALGLEPTGT